MGGDMFGDLMIRDEVKRIADALDLISAALLFELTLRHFPTEIDEEKRKFLKVLEAHRESE